ncbi:MAG TPA: gamma carbonic anhydrase family protein [archaeon]|nr:gamma carbonic anhydrase family protein [archaeon]
MIVGFENKSPKIHKTAFVAPTAELIGDVRIGEDASIWFGAVLRGDMHYIKIGKNSSVQDNSVLHGTMNKFPTIIGDNVSVGHNAIVHGCVVGNNCIIGMGAIILEGAEIGDWCIIGAGSLVTEGAKIPSNSIVLGIPGKVVKQVSEEHKKRITDNWKEYVGLKNKYMKK